MNLDHSCIFSASDRGFFRFLRGLIISLKRQHALRAVPIVVFDLGLDTPHQQWLTDHDVALIRPRAHLGFEMDTTKRTDFSFLVRPFLAEYEPQYRHYVWLDADAWLQNPETVLRLVEGAEQTGFALAHEDEPSYGNPFRLRRWNLKHALLSCGLVDGIKVLRNRVFNAGIFAGHRDADQWAIWRRYYAQGIAKNGKAAPNDQFCLNQAIHCGGMEVRALEPHYNWICDRATPLYDPHRRVFCHPNDPQKVISCMHLAGPAKYKEMPVPLSDGRVANMMLTFVDEKVDP